MESIKQTAVEWLFEKLWETPKDKLNWYAILYHAKEMEKQQIVNAVDGFPLNNRNLEGEMYYNETYGN
jgi:hypothetical protein